MFDFDEVYQKNREGVWRLISRYADSKVDREDLFQEAFLNIYRGLAKFKGESDIKTWVFRIAINTAMNGLKRKRREKRLKKILQNLRFIDFENKEEFSDTLLKPLEKLSERQKMILLLSDVEEYKLQEISEIINIPTGTVKSTLSRARAILRKEVEKDETEL